MGCDGNHDSGQKTDCETIMEKQTRQQMIAEIVIALLFVTTFGFALIGFGFACSRGWSYVLHRLHWSDSQALINR